MTKRGPFRERSRITKYQNPWLRLEEAQVLRPDGTLGVFGLVYMTDGCTVVAIDEALNVLLVNEYKYALGRESLELVSGAIDAGETPEQAGLRELQEETGLTAAKVQYLGCIDPFTTLVSSRNHMMLVQELSPVLRPPSTDDVLQVCKVNLADAINYVEEGKITHGASCVALLRAGRILGY